MQLVSQCRLGILLLLSLWQCLLCNCSSIQTELISCDQRLSTAPSFSSRWATLGPFRIGTREALWGADPLEANGGFVHLPYDNTTSFHSSLAKNATVKWSINRQDAIVDNDSTAHVNFRLSHPAIDWEGQHQVYGWPALQYQSWTRGYLFNHAACTQRVLLRPSGILEFYVNGFHVFGGDFYGFARAPILVELLPGRNKLDIRLIRDVRSMGASVPPMLEAHLRCELALEDIVIDSAQLVAPNLVAGRLPSPYFSVPITNLHTQKVSIVECSDVVEGQGFELLRSESIILIPGQTRFVAYQMHNESIAQDAQLSICYQLESTNGQTRLHRHHVSIKLKSRTLHEAHKFTFLHPSGAISYAVLKPPSNSLSPAQTRPLMIILHGAGVEADSQLVRHSLDGVPEMEAFSLFPTGMSPWSGDDWHVWGHADLIAAIDAVGDWVKRMGWNGSSVATRQVFVTGHSNGGQGTWFFISHMPDRTLAAAPLSGYTSIENYIPYTFWTESDPLKQAIVSMARISFKHEVFVENIADVPILQQHGSADDNVPPYHSRLMNSLLARAGSRAQYVELPNKGHWFDGVMTTSYLRDFYRRYLSATPQMRVIRESFSVVSVATDEMGPKNGISIEQLHSPDRLGRVDAQIDMDVSSATTVWHLQSYNVRRLRLLPKTIRDRVFGTLVIDLDGLRVNVSNQSETSCFLQDVEFQWAVQGCLIPETERTGRQRGSLESIMRTTAPFEILTDKDLLQLGLQISRNLLQYFGADSVLRHIEQRSETLSAGGNVIVLSLERGAKVPSPMASSFPITFTDRGIRLCSQSLKCHTFLYDTIVGAVILRPLPRERLEVLVWGSNLAGAQTAARLLPSLTGVGQPDFVILGTRSRWHGLEGAASLGFFDHSWNISQASYI